MLRETIIIYGGCTFLHAAAAALAWWGHQDSAGRAWIWLCVVGANVLWGLRSAIPFWVAINVGLYDFRDALVSALAATFCLAAVAGGMWHQRASH